jgi:hypothetical protein
MIRVFNPYCYKKPTPTDVININRLDFLSRALFREILAMCRNEPELDVFISGNKQFSVNLERGQTILKVGKIAKELGISPDKINNRLKIINEIYTEIDIQGMPYGSIVTLKDYDSLIKMIGLPTTETSTNLIPSSYETVTSNKNVNTDKNVNIYKKNSSKEKQSLQALTEQFNPSFPLGGR